MPVVISSFRTQVSMWQSTGGWEEGLETVLLIHKPQEPAAGKTEMCGRQWTEQTEPVPIYLPGNCIQACSCRAWTPWSFSPHKYWVKYFSVISQWTWSHLQPWGHLCKHYKDRYFGLRMQQRRHSVLSCRRSFWIRPCSVYPHSASGISNILTNLCISNLMFLLQ